MTLSEEFIKSHPCVDSSIIDALQGRARCESDAILNALEEYKKAALPEAKPLPPIKFKIPKVETYRDKDGKLCKRFVCYYPDYGIAIQAPKIFNPHILGMDQVAPDSDTDLKINVKRRNIKFNFNN